MFRRPGFCLLILTMFVAVPVARAGGPSPGALQDGVGVMAPGGTDRYMALGAGDHTLVAAVRRSTGSLRASTLLSGSLGIPAVTVGLRGGLSPDGRTLVLARTTANSPSTFVVLDTRTLRETNRITLKGSFSFDALSPDGARLYLIQHMSLDDYAHYVVRAYDLRANRLLPGRIADKAQKGWVMQGLALTRTTSMGGRWAYTLYMNPGGYPFIHALDTVRGVAHCIGLPWTGDQGALANLVLKADGRSGSLSVQWRSGRPWLAIDTTDWRITHRVSSGGHGFAWRWALAGGGAALLVALALVAVVVGRRRHPREAAPVAL